MNDEIDTNDLAACLAAIASSTGKPVPDHALNVWRIGLRGISKSALASALEKFIQENKFPVFPTPGAIRALAVETEAKSEMSDEERAGIAWSAVRSAIRCHGQGATVDFDDPLVNAAIRDIGDWISLCDVLTDEIKWKERDFKAAYVMRARGGAGNGAPLLGMYGGRVVKIKCELPAHPKALGMTRAALPDMSEATKKFLDDSKIGMPRK